MPNLGEMFQTRFCAAFVAILSYGLSATGHGAENLVIDFMMSSGSQRTAWVEVIERFSEQNPDIKITHREFPQEEYKQRFEGSLSSERIDIAFWFAGERLKQFADKKLLAPLNDEFVRKTARTRLAKATLDATQAGGKTWGFPVSYYPWGFFYRKSLFKRLGISPPATWPEFLQAGKILKRAGITPTATGAVSGWPAAAWFDYLNLRMNGLEFHQKLLAGDVPFSDPRVRRVFNEWKQLLDNDWFLDEATSTDWDGVLPFLYRERIGMALMGGFAAAKFPPGAMSDDIGFFAFPGFDTKMPVFEDAPLDVLVLPARGENPKAAYRFLAYLASQNDLNRYNETIRQTSPLLGAPRSNDPILRASQSILDRASGISFFFDRDARAQLVKPGFDAFKQFLTPPHDVELAIRTLGKHGVNRSTPP